MEWLQLVALVFCSVATILHVSSVAISAVRCGGLLKRKSSLLAATPVALLRPVRGIDPYDELTLKSGFDLSYPEYELIFCCASASDPAVPVIRRLMSAHPGVPARLLIGDERGSVNPKLNNLVKGWDATDQDWVVFADSNVLMPTDYMQRLFRTWKADTGLVCSPPVGCMAQGFWAELECAFLNTYQARWQYAADTVGLGFAQGKTMLWRRKDLDTVGGIRALGAEIAEDATATKIVRGQGRRVRLVDRPFPQPLGRRSAKQVWDRQIRWARLRRATFPGYYVPELLTGSLLPMVAAAYAADGLDLSSAAAVAALAILWFGSEAVLARVAGWHLTALSPVTWAVRDALLPLLWFGAWTSNSFVWRGNSMTMTRSAAGDAAR